MRFWTALGGALIALALLAAPALAQREHRVRSGQSLARIARRYDVSVGNLAAANSLARGASLRPGQVLRIPERGVHYVASGETLASIARQHDCRVRDLQQANRLRGGSLRIGQRLQLPGFDSVRTRSRAERRWGRPRSPGVVTLYRRSMDRRLRVRLVDRRGRARRVARRRLQEMMRTVHGRRALGPLPPSRLVEILARISDHFGGRMLTIVSGYRGAGGYTRESSRHISGNALDLRVQGVPNTVLRDYVRETFNHVGVGFYPRSHFIHLDVRGRDAYWVDRSAPGEAPRYDRRAARGQSAEATAPTEAAPAEAAPAEAAPAEAPTEPSTPDDG